MCITSDVCLSRLKGHTLVSGHTHYLGLFLQQLSWLGRENSSLNVVICLSRVLSQSLPSGPSHSLYEFSLLDQTAKVHLCFDSSSWVDLL